MNRVSNITRLLDRAAAAEEDARLVDALRAYRKALDIDAQCKRALLGVARLTVLMGHPERAMEIATHALMVDRNCADAYVIRAQAMAGLDLQERAQREIDTALELAPSSIDALLVRAELERDRGDLAAAQATLRSALDVDPLDADVTVALALCLAQAHDADGLAAEAVADEIDSLLDRARQGFGDDDPLILLLAATLALACEEGEVRDALDAIESALDVEPELAEVAVAIPTLRGRLELE